MLLFERKPLFFLSKLKGSTSVLFLNMDFITPYTAFLFSNKRYCCEQTQILDSFLCLWFQLRDIDPLKNEVPFELEFMHIALCWTLLANNWNGKEKRKVV